jgi:hypothetical protein
MASFFSEAVTSMRRALASSATGIVKLSTPLSYEAAIFSVSRLSPKNSSRLKAGRALAHHRVHTLGVPLALCLYGEDVLLDRDLDGLGPHTWKVEVDVEHVAHPKASIRHVAQWPAAVQLGSQLLHLPKGVEPHRHDSAPSSCFSLVNIKPSLHHSQASHQAVAPTRVDRPFGLPGSRAERTRWWRAKTAQGEPHRW